MYKDFISTIFEYFVITFLQQLLTILYIFELNIDFNLNNFFMVLDIIYMFYFVI